MSRAMSKPDLTFVTLIHQSLRADAARLAATIVALGAVERAPRLPGIEAYFDRYCDQLVTHHRHEDGLFFPALAASAGADKMHLNELDDQHHELDTAIRAVRGKLAALADPANDFATERASAADAMSAMTALLDAHLTLEEETAVPLLETHMAAADYKKLEARARKATPRPNAQFLVPWVVAHASPDQRRALYRSAPPLRLIYWLNLRRYRRLAQALVPAGERVGR
jgi:hemerythrin-like domain-containing protein